MHSKVRTLIPQNASLTSNPGPLRDPRAMQCMERATNLGVVTQLRPRASELPLDTALMNEARRSADGLNRIIGYALLVVTFAIAIVLLWPFLAARFS